MKKLRLKTHQEVASKFKNYPKEVKPKLNQLRNLILETAKEIDAIEEIEETLKWGEPSYLVKKGSTIRIDWKAKTPDQYAMYFKCTSKLVPTFRTVFGDRFNFENNRAILFHFDQVIPEKELKVCIGLALEYHKVKELPNLGLGD